MAANQDLVGVFGAEETHARLHAPVEPQQRVAFRDANEQRRLLQCFKCSSPREDGPVEYLANYCRDPVCLRKRPQISRSHYTYGVQMYVLGVLYVST